MRKNSIPYAIGNDLIPYFPLATFVPGEEGYDQFLSSNSEGSNDAYSRFLELLGSHKDKLIEYANEKPFTVPDGEQRYAVFCALLVAEHSGQLEAGELSSVSWETIYSEILASSLPQSIKNNLFGWEAICNCYTEDSAIEYLNGLSADETRSINQMKADLFDNPSAPAMIDDWIDRGGLSSDTQLFIDAVYLICEHI